MSSTLLRSEGRVILVSGANRGIGRAIAECLHERGYSLSLGARDPQRLKPLTASHMDQSRTFAHAYDARVARSPSDWVAATHRKFGRIDGVINNAGVMYSFDVENDDDARLDDMWEVNAKAPMRLIRAAFPYLKKSGAGRVINIASLSGKRVKSAGVGGYAMTKHALVALSHAVRYAGWEHGIRAAAVCPGYVATDLTSDVNALPEGQMIPPEVVATLVATLLALPNSASVAELPINCVLEHTF
ncbi:MAG: SDR family NAD(P)-dependent oxidoreductase [Gammaproteobacteria bacterium]